jgi:Cdc6-like AAA superfamily ATPase
LASDADRLRFEMRIGEVFTPAAPIDKASLFAGRVDQLRQILDAVSQRGQHAIIYGERGVGKTSLTNVLVETLKGVQGSVICPHVNCDSADDYASLWRKVFLQIDLARSRREVGFEANLFQEVSTLADSVPVEIFSGEVQRILTQLSERSLVVIVLDEFDRISAGPTRALLADTIKMLSDHSIPVTLLIVGVADTVDQLIQDHQSVERALAQVPMPRMSATELREILDKGLSELAMEMKDEVKGQIADLSRGLPHYTHLLAKNAARAALDSGSKEIRLGHLSKAIERSVAEAQQSVKSAYHKATTSTQTGNLYRQVLLACAMANTDPMGFFAPADVRDPLSRIMGEPMEIPRFQRHLNDFVTDTRGKVLQRVGGAHRWRYRFSNPLLQPFVFLEGESSGLLPRNREPKAAER